MNNAVGLVVAGWDNGQIGTISDNPLPEHRLIRRARICFNPGATRFVRQAAVGGKCSFTPSPAVKTPER
jgi:hypothetical protein